MALAQFRMLNNNFPNKDPDVVPEQSPLIILDSKSAVCMSKNRKETKQTRHISRIMHFVRNGEEFNLHKKVWCEEGLQLAEIWTDNIREYGLNNKLRYYMVRLYNRKNTCTRGVIGYRRGKRTMCSELIDWIELRIWLNEYEMFIWI